MDDTPIDRRRLLAGAGAVIAAAGLSGCASDPGSGAPASTTKPRSPSRSSPPGLDEASLRRKIASLLVVGFRGDKVNPDDWIMKAIRGGLGGVILFDRDQQTKQKRNINSPAQVMALTKALRQAAPGGRLIVSTDQEGGLISRLNPQNGFPATKSEAEIGSANSPSTTKAWAKGIVSSLTSAGMNLNFAPVADLNVNPKNPAIGALGRSFSANASVVVANATEEITVHRAAAIKTVVKHFPGLGSATGNTDFGVVDVTKTWHQTELVPFTRLIDAGMADSIMAAHLLNKQLDPDRPTSLSHAVITDLLRGKLGYRGPVVSDDMQAVAITSKYGRAQAVTMALEAGLDLLVFANQEAYDPKIVDETLDTVVGLVRTGHVTTAQIDASVARVDTLRPKA